MSAASEIMRRTHYEVRPQLVHDVYMLQASQVTVLMFPFGAKYGETDLVRMWKPNPSGLSEAISFGVRDSHDGPVRLVVDAIRRGECFSSLHGMMQGSPRTAPRLSYPRRTVCTYVWVCTQIPDRTVNFSAAIAIARLPDAKWEQRLVFFPATLNDQLADTELAGKTFAFQLDSRMVGKAAGKEAKFWIVREIPDMHHDRPPRTWDPKQDLVYADAAQQREYVRRMLPEAAADLEKVWSDG